MLQTIHEIYPARKASSLYCIWTTTDGRPNSPLVALWIDPSMHTFEGEFSLTAQADSAEITSDEPGGCALTTLAVRTATTEEMDSF